MQVEDDIIENKFVEMLCRNFKRSRLQINGLNESDSEIILIPGTTIKLAVTTDNISEEIEKGLYEDPYQIGYMSVMVNASDIAAVGAEPFGLLLNQTFRDNTPESFISELQRGIEDACDKTGFFIFGGDTNYSSTSQFGAVALGLITGDKVITRKGCNKNDIVYISGKAGRGNAFALSKMLKSENLISFMPVSRLKEGRIIRKYATCCMDTSDGVISAFDQLMRINQKGFMVEEKPEVYIDEESIGLSKSVNKSPLIMLAGQHGEFELVFTIPEKNNNKFLEEAEAVNWLPVKIGYVINDKDLILSDNDFLFKPDSAKIRNLLNAVQGNIEKYIQELFKIFNF